jgi:hypothetical protein
MSREWDNVFNSNSFRDGRIKGLRNRPKHAVSCSVAVQIASDERCGRSVIGDDWRHLSSEGIVNVAVTRLRHWHNALWPSMKGMGVPARCN